MHDCKVKLKNGVTVTEEFWSFEWETIGSIAKPVALQLVGMEPIPLSSIESATLIRGRATAATVGKDEDLLERARRMGWTGS